MCGIVGVVGSPGAHHDWVDAASLSLHHRGPDDHGRHTSDDGRVALGHRRLAVIDLSPGGHQPMVADDGRVLVYNGELYNHVELRRELVASGHAIRSASDTEVILAAHAQWGAECVTRFVGMWALALYDPRESTVWMSRDPFGIKPLYWARTESGIAFASEPRPIVTLVGGRVDAQIAYDYLRWGHVDRTDRTFITGIEALPPGGSLRCDTRTGALAFGPAWELPGRATSETVDMTRDEAVHELRRLLFESVALHLRSDVAVGSALSGGLDSSAIVMLMRELAGQADLHAFSFVAPGSVFDESTYSAAVAAAAGATRHAIRIADADIPELCGDVADAQFEPFGSLSIAAQHAVFRAAREAGVTVMLDGQGADELFGGYPSFVVDLLADQLARGRVAAAGRLAPSVLRQAGSAALARAAARALPRRAAVALWGRWMARSVPEWLDVGWFEAQGVMTDAAAIDLPASFDEAIDGARMSTSLPGLLRYEDRNSMAFSVESRVPFLTPQLAAFAAALPAEWMVDRRGRRKALLVDAMRGVVPDLVLDRVDKVAFSVPQAQWQSSLPDTGRVPGLNPGVAARDVRAWSYAAFVERL